MKLHDLSRGYLILTEDGVICEWLKDYAEAGADPVGIPVARVEYANLDEGGAFLREMVFRWNAYTSLADTRFWKQLREC